MFKIFPVFFHDEGTPSGAPANTPPVVSAAQIAEETLKLIDAASEKKARGIAKSMAEQNGLTEEELLASIAEKKAAKAKALPEDAQKQIDAARAEVQKLRLESALAKEGAALGLLDAEVAIKLLPADAIKINDKGEVTGLKEALEKLKETKPYLFKTVVGRADVGGKVSGTSGTLTGVEERFYAKNPGLKKPV